VLLLAIGIPRVSSKLSQLNHENSRIHANALQAAKKTEQLRNAISAILKQVHVENERLIVSIPSEITAQARNAVGRTMRKTVRVNTTQIKKDIQGFDDEISAVGADIMQKVRGIESLFEVITSEPTVRSNDAPKAG
jgi:hypothetical protein